MNEDYSHIEKYEIVGIAVKKRKKKKNKEYKVKLHFEPSIKCPANFDDNIFKKQLVCDNRLEIYNATVQEPPPLPYNLNDILNEMLNGWNIKKNDTYQILQKLHKEYKCITNPNTNCRYLSTGQWIDVKTKTSIPKTFLVLCHLLRVVLLMMTKLKMALAYHQRRQIGMILNKITM